MDSAKEIYKGMPKKLQASDKRDFFMQYIEKNKINAKKIHN